MQWREANRRRQRQTNQHHGLVPEPPPPPPRSSRIAPGPPPDAPSRGAVQGQIEVEQAAVVTDYADAILIHNSRIQELNADIRASGTEKVKILKEIKVLWPGSLWEGLGGVWGGGAASGRAGGRVGLCWGGGGGACGWTWGRAGGRAWAGGEGGMQLPFFSCFCIGFAFSLLLLWQSMDKFVSHAPF